LEGKNAVVLFFSPALHPYSISRLAIFPNRARDLETEKLAGGIHPYFLSAGYVGVLGTIWAREGTLDISTGPHPMMNHAHGTKWTWRWDPQWFQKYWQCVCILKCTFTIAKTASKGHVGAPNLIS
jgi:hypothetical protein